MTKKNVFLMYITRATFMTTFFVQTCRYKTTNFVQKKVVIKVCSARDIYLYIFTPSIDVFDCHCKTILFYLL